MKIKIRTQAKSKVTKITNEQWEKKFEKMGGDSKRQGR